MLDEEINNHSLILGFVSIVVTLFFSWGGKAAIAFAFVAIFISYRNPGPIGQKNTIMWLVLGVVSYISSVWNYFNGWIGNFFGIISSLFFLGNAFYLTMNKIEKKLTKIVIFAILGLIFIHLIFVIIKTILLINSYRKFALMFN